MDIKKYLLLIFIFITSFSYIFSTEQIGDYLLYNGKIYDFNEPQITYSIRVYFNINLSQYSNCWRGYRSLWVVKDNHIYFKQILDKDVIFVNNEKEEEKLSTRFINSIVNIFNPQTWNYQLNNFTGKLKITETKRYGDISAYRLTIKAGQVVNEEDCSYINKSEFRNMLRIVYKYYSNANYHDAYKRSVSYRKFISPKNPIYDSFLKVEEDIKKRDPETNYQALYDNQ